MKAEMYNGSQIEYRLCHHVLSVWLKIVKVTSNMFIVKYHKNTWFLSDRFNLFSLEMHLTKFNFFLTLIQIFKFTMNLKMKAGNSKLQEGRE